MSRKEFNIVRHNLENLCASLDEAVKYIKDKFPHSDTIEEFSRYNRNIGSVEDMGGFIFSNRGGMTNREMPAFLLDSYAMGFPHFKDFFINEFRRGTRDGTYNDPERALKIYKDLAAWGCFDVDMNKQRPNLAYTALRNYLSLKVTVKKDPVPIPEIFVKSCDFKFKDLENPSHYIDQKIEAIAAVIQAHGHLDDLKFVFHDYDYKTETGYIEIRSTRDFSEIFDLVMRECPYVSDAKPKAKPLSNDFESQVDKRLQSVKTSPLRRRGPKR